MARILELYGNSITDRHTHYEAHGYLSETRGRVLVTIPGHVAQEFQERYGMPITDCERFEAAVDVIRNGSHVAPNQFMPPGGLRATLGSIEDVFLREKR